MAGGIIGKSTWYIYVCIIIDTFDNSTNLFWEYIVELYLSHTPVTIVDGRGPPFFFT